MTFQRLLIILQIVMALAPWVSRAYGEDLAHQTGERLAARLGSAKVPTRLTVQGEQLQRPEMIYEFYRLNAFRPAWISTQGPSGQARELVEILRETEGEGLDPNDYHLPFIERGLSDSRQTSPNPDILADLDLLLTDAFLLYASHLIKGRLTPEALDSEWHIRPRRGEPVSILKSSLESGIIAETLRGLGPQTPGYGRLAEALRHYRQIRAKGGWPTIPDGPPLRKGNTGPRVAALKARLAVTGDMDQHLAEGDEFDPHLEDGVRRFQGRHGLNADGVVGAKTLAALNVPVEERIKQIMVNLERLRWLPADLGRRYIVVNSADFQLHVVEDEKEIMRIRAIVGRPYRQTPSFRAIMTHLVFSPYWHIPKSIAVKDILPRVIRDPNYLSRERIRVFRGRSPDQGPVNPATIDWRRLGPQNFPYRLRQEPGPRNSLGRIKFIFPNRFDVYIHDTPARELFEKDVRSFSSGCIRIEKPLELAEYLLADDPSWDRGRILKAMESPREQTVRLLRPMPVYFLYWTAWVDDDGLLQFREDIYGRDAGIAAALMGGVPVS